MCLWLGTPLRDMNTTRSRQRRRVCRGSYVLKPFTHTHTQAHTVYLTFRDQSNSGITLGAENIIYERFRGHTGRTTMRRTRRRYWFQNGYARVAEQQQQQQPGCRRTLLSHEIVASHETTRTCRRPSVLLYDTLLFYYHLLSYTVYERARA
jgi:hypothetical protein